MEHAQEVDAQYIVSAEARGFVLGGAAASAAGLGFVLGRKPGKLPRETAAVEYELEYGTDVLEVHTDAFPAGARVLVHDDLLATGGTADALCELVERAGARGGGLRVPDRAGVPGRPRAAGGAQGREPGLLRLGIESRRARRKPLQDDARRTGADLDARWPIPGTCRAGGPAWTRVEEASRDAWTAVLTSGKGKWLRADYTLLESEHPRLLRWRHEVEESPFERILASSVTELELEPVEEGTRVTPDRPHQAAWVLAFRRPADPARHHAPVRRRPGRARRSSPRLAERMMRWWGWGEDEHASPLPSARRRWSLAAGRGARPAAAERGGA